MRKVTVVGLALVLGASLLLYFFYGRLSGGATCAAKPELILAIDVDNTLGHTIPLRSLGEINPSTLDEKDLILKHVFVVNRDRHRKEYGYYRRLIEAPPADGGLLLENLDDSHIRATEHFALRPSMFNFLANLGRELATFGPVRFMITSRGLDERIKSLVSSIPLSINGTRFGKLVQIAPRASLRVELDIDGKKLPGKSMAALWKNVFGGKDDMIFIGIDDISADRFVLRPMSGDILAQVKRFYYFDLLRKDHVERDEHHLQEVKNDVIGRLSRNRQPFCNPHSR